METTSIAKNVLYQRKLKGYTQEELAQKTQVTIRTIQRIEKGEVNPHLQTVKLHAVALEVEVEDLLPIQTPKPQNPKTPKPRGIMSVLNPILSEMIWFAVESIIKLWN